MNLKTNSQDRILIDITPENDTSTYRVLHNLTEFKFNLTHSKTDRKYFHNLGDTTSIITGRTKTITLTFDVDTNDDLHKYLLKLLTGSISALNNQKIKLQTFVHYEDNNQLIEISGKAAFDFKNFLPSGAVDELQTLSFDILPQDNAWTTVSRPISEALNEGVIVPLVTVSDKDLPKPDTEQENTKQPQDTDTETTHETTDGHTQVDAVT
mgnify:CR=1 FL=1